MPAEPLGVTVPPGALTASIQKSIEQALETAVPPGKRAAVVAVADPTGVKLGVAARLGDHWKLAGDVERDWSGAVTGSVGVAGSW